MAMNGRDLFAQSDQQVSVLKQRIALQREAIKQAKLRGYSTAAAETIQRALHESLRAFEKRRQQVFEMLEAKRRPTVKREAEEDWS
jgi:predicted RNA-binding protein